MEGGREQSIRLNETTSFISSMMQLVECWHASLPARIQILVKSFYENVYFIVTLFYVWIFNHIDIGRFLI